MRDRAFQNKPRRQIELDRVWAKVPLHKFHLNHKLIHRQRLFTLVPGVLRWNWRHKEHEQNRKLTEHETHEERHH